ncbi:uncharacterized protein LOC120041685 [Salvelinus namaycush]|uniref:Uncharacterized protein LOC120041685 n=1 Tax=Salvelinus namaycush TaxID=8040 RepID=A0A8U0QFK9_SALNM|nr:uncharacterized protein LOC120041685 [Salvelinus namaycush]
MGRCDLTLDPNTAHRNLSLSEGNRRVERVKEEQPYPDQPERFDLVPHVLCREGLTGRCYWEVEWSGLADIGVTYKGNSRKGDGSFCDFGYNNKSWRLACRGNHYIALHNNEYTTIPAPHLINPPQPQGDLSSSTPHLINPPQPQGDLSSSPPHLINPPQPQGDLSSSPPHLINPPQPQGDLSSSPPHLINPPQPQGDLSSSTPHLINPPQPQGDLSSSPPHLINPPQPQGDLSSSPPHLINPPQPQGDLSSSPPHLINPPQPQGDLSSSTPRLINPPQPQGDLSSSPPHLINPPQPQGDLSSSPPHLINPPQPQGDLSSSPPHLINPPQPQGDLSSSTPRLINPPQPQGDLSSSPPHLINPPQPQGDLSSSPPHLINPPQPQGDLSSSPPHLINPPQPQGDLSSSTPRLINPPQPQGDLSSSPPHLINPPQPQGDLSSSPPHLINPPQPQGDLSSSTPRPRVGVFLDWPTGTLSFYKVYCGLMTHLYTFQTIFTEPLYPTFGLQHPHTSVSLGFASNPVSSETVPNHFEPEIYSHEGKGAYRFQCPSAGLFQCSITGLVFRMEGEGEVLYRTVHWDRKLLSQSGKRPAGPLFNIDCPQKAVCQLHLPHCQIHSGGGCDFLSVAHVTEDDIIEFLPPHEITDTHVIISITGFSAYGDVTDEDAPISPILAHVLLFYQPLGKRSILNVLLLPSNVVRKEVRELIERDGIREILTTSLCTLTPKQEYTLSTNPADAHPIQPNPAKFVDSYENYVPTFQLFIKPVVEEVNLLLEENKADKLVWNGLIWLPVTPPGGATAGTTKVHFLLINILKELGQSDLKTFQWYLTKGVDEFPSISVGLLEGADNLVTVDRMVSFHDEGAVKITLKILREMGLNSLAEELKKQRKLKKQV